MSLGGGLEILAGKSSCKHNAYTWSLPDPDKTSYVLEFKQEQKSGACPSHFSGLNLNHGLHSGASPLNEEVERFGSVSAADVCHVSWGLLLKTIWYSTYLVSWLRICTRVRRRR